MPLNHLCTLCYVIISLTPNLRRSKNLIPKNLNRIRKKLIRRKMNEEKFKGDFFMMTTTFLFPNTVLGFSELISVSS